MNFDKSIFIVSTPRSGSTFFSQIVHLYISKKFNGNTRFIPGIFETKSNFPGKNGEAHFEHVTCHGELYESFDLDTLSNIVRVKRKYNCNSVDEFIVNELKRRTNIVCISDRALNFNVFHTHFKLLDNNVIKFLKQNYSDSVITVRRKDQWDQILSFGISYYSGIWMSQHLTNKHHRLDLNEKSYTYDIGLFRRHCDRLLQIQFDRFSEFKSIFYEDFCMDPLDSIPELLPIFSDLKDYVSHEDLNSIEQKMIYPCSKEQLFTNIDDMKLTFDECISSQKLITG